MDRQQLSAIAHQRHPIACPFGDNKVETLLDHLNISGAATVLDIGCGQGEWLGRLLTQHPDSHATGIDQSARSLEAARARTGSVAARLQLEQVDAAPYVAQCSDRFDVVMCVGSTHALGGYKETLTKARPLIAKQGKLLVAEGYWQQPPAHAALAALDAKGDEFMNLDETVKTAIAAGYTPHYVATSNQDEWDHYEWCWCGSLEQYALQHSSEDGIEDVVKTARSHRDGYMFGYRGFLGFVALILAPTL